MKQLKILVLGTGDMGSAIATALETRTDHTILVRGSSEESVSSKLLADELGLAKANSKDLSTTDVVFVVVPPSELGHAATFLNNFSGVAVSVSVSRTVGQDGKISSAETLAKAIPRAKVVSAFTSMWSNVIRNPGAEKQVSVFVASDHDDAKQLVTTLAAEMHFDAIDGGSLANALYSEVMGMFAVRLAMDSNYGRTIAFRAFNVA